MGAISIDSVTEGMVLESDVEEQGQVLLKAGMTLTERHLKICRSWGIASLPIRGAEPEAVDPDPFAGVDPVIIRIAEEEARAHCALMNLERSPDRELFTFHWQRLVLKQRSQQ